MMTSLGGQYSHPGGIQQHPGAPQGHPMQAGMAVPHSQGQVQPGMPQQMYMGVSGPGGPQVSQAGVMMGGGMPPGSGGPSAHALQHLNPQQQQQQQQQAAMCKCSLHFRHLCKERRLLRSRHEADILVGQNADRLPNYSREPSIPATTATTTYFEPTARSSTTSHDTATIQWWWDADEHAKWHGYDSGAIHRDALWTDGAAACQFTPTSSTTATSSSNRPGTGAGSASSTTSEFPISICSAVPRLYTILIRTLANTYNTTSNSNNLSRNKWQCKMLKGMEETTTLDNKTR
jgi:hypothetical protein